ncbi:MAG: hypothetical protein J6X75_00780 [Clostridia bacterium]|nr:hypothetical protein [Clostridia bacterium]
MEKYIPNFSASEVQNQTQMMVRWANRLTSNFLIIADKLDRISWQLEQQAAAIADLTERVRVLEQQQNGGS